VSHNIFRSLEVKERIEDILRVYCDNKIFWTLRNAVPCGTTLQTGRSWVRSPMRSLNFSIDLILPSALLPWGELSL
jgi:hypothetical protein